MAESVLTGKSCYHCGVGVVRRTGESTVKLTVLKNGSIVEVVKPIEKFVCSRCKRGSWLFAK